MLLFCMFRLEVPRYTPLIHYTAGKTGRETRGSQIRLITQRLQFGPVVFLLRSRIVPYIIYCLLPGQLPLQLGSSRPDEWFGSSHYWQPAYQEKHANYVPVQVEVSIHIIYELPKQVRRSRYIYITYWLAAKLPMPGEAASHLCTISPNIRIPQYKRYNQMCDQLRSNDCLAQVQLPSPSSKTFRRGTRLGK
jgi:hypothetical protein